jgi:hypothetical protein
VSDLEPRKGSRPSRQARADRAYTLVKVTSGLLLLTIVLFVLAVVGIVGGGWAVAAGAVTVGAGVALRRTLKS